METERGGSRAARAKRRELKRKKKKKNTLDSAVRDRTTQVEGRWEERHNKTKKKRNVEK